MYEYRIKKIAKMVDGDTFDADIDLGFYATIRIRVRLFDIDTYEIYGKNTHELGVPARDAAEEWMQKRLENDTLGIKTFADNIDVPVPQGGFGRWAGIVYDLHTSELLSEFLRKEGFEDKK